MPENSWPISLDGSFQLNGIYALCGVPDGAVDATGQSQALSLDGSFTLSGSNTLDGLIG